MLKQIISYIWIITSLTGNVSSETVKQGDTYKLDLTSVKFVLRKVKFSYTFKEPDITSNLLGITASCFNGKIVSERPGWTIEKTEEFVVADTKEKLDFLTLICKRSILSKTES